MTLSLLTLPCHFFFRTDPECSRSISTQTTGSYRKVNPTLETLVTSLAEIVDTLQRAPPEWWKEGGTDDAALDNHKRLALEDDDDDDESIDLQKMAELSENNEDEELADVDSDKDSND